MSMTSSVDKIPTKIRKPSVYVVEGSPKKRKVYQFSKTEVIKWGTKHSDVII
jgi:hypothetical protein